MKSLTPLALLLSSLTLTLTATLPANSHSPLPLLELAEGNVSSTTTSLSSRGVHCKPTVPFSPFYLTMHGCAAAIYEVHPSEDVGEFHTGAPWNDFTLPITRTSGYCKATVEMAAPGLEEKGSWLGVSHALSQLNLLCASKYKYRYAGGWSLTGNTNGIKVRLDWYTTSAVGNQTETVETA